MTLRQLDTQFDSIVFPTTHYGYDDGLDKEVETPVLLLDGHYTLEDLRKILEYAEKVL